MELHPVGEHGPPAYGRTNVSADARGARPRDARTGALTLVYFPLRPGGGLPTPPQTSGLGPKAAASNPSAESPRLRSSRIAAARLGMRLRKRKSSRTV